MLQNYTPNFTEYLSKIGFYFEKKGFDLTMGRTQVSRNQRLGRPGGKGRGSAGRGNKPKNDHTKDLGDNSYRFETKNHYKNQDYENWEIAAEAAYGPSHESVQSMMGKGIEESNDNQSIFMASIDVIKMNKCLENLEASIWMNLPDRILDIYDNKYGTRSNEESKTYTISEMNSNPQIGGTQDEQLSEDVKNLRLDDAMNIDGESWDEDSDSKDENDSEEEEDLDAWLDDMIDT